jgi:hypothetical protein
MKPIQIFLKFIHHGGPLRQYFAVLVLGTAAAITLPVADAEEASGQPSEDVVPGAPRLLPSDTLAYIRLDDADDLREDLDKSSLGKMFDDPKMRPFIDEFYSIARELFAQISDEVGVSLDELLAIPHGQVAIAVHPTKPLDEDEKPQPNFADDDDQDDRARRLDRQRRREAYSFGGVLIVDAGENVDDLLAIVDRLEQRATQGGFVRRIKKIEDTEVVRWVPTRFGRQPVEHFEKDGVLVIGLGNQVAQDVLKHWLDESDEPTLADNATFGTIMSRCVGAESTRPQVTFFADPHNIIDRIIKRSGSMSAGLVWPVIEDLGAARVDGIGGSSFRGGDIFENIAHYHIKVEPPRDGVLGVLRPETGSTTPPKWVPDSVMSYTSLNWDFSQAYENLGKVIDRFQGEDSLKRFVETPIQTRTGVELQDELFDNMTGRLVRVAWMQQPIRFNSGVTVVAIELNDPIKMKSTLAKVRDRMPNQLRVETVAGNVLYRMREPGGENFPETMRRPQPSLILLDKWLIYADSVEFMKKAALASAGKLPRLSELPDFGLVASELGGKLRGEQPFLLSYLKGSDGIRLLYDMAKDENSKQMLRRAAENNPAAAKFSALLDKYDLPPFSEFEKYFAPTGAFAYDEPDGMHFGFYTLRADPELQGDEEDK